MALQISPSPRIRSSNLMRDLAHIHSRSADRSHFIGHIAPSNNCKI